MEDQFGGRTDDDLFYDDFEPVVSEAILVRDSPDEPAFEPEAEPAAAAAAAAAPAPAPEPESEPEPKRQQPAPVPATPSTRPKSSTPPVSKTKKPQQQSRGLASSRFADKPPAPKHEPAPKTSPKPAPKPAPELAPEPTQESKSESALESASAPEPTQQSSSAQRAADAPTAPREKQPRHQSQNTAANAEARMQSGANPRQKLTEQELAAKMEQMRLLNAEKTRQFEKAERDEKQHAEAYARGMEEARKRRVEEAEKRRRGEEDRRKLEDERAKNRERKLKAMSIKDNSWDEGKEALAEEEAKRGFRGANGGIRGSKSRGLAGSRYAVQDEERPDVDRFLEDRYRDRGRDRAGRGGGRGGRGGRGGFDGQGNNRNTNSAPANPLLPKQAIPVAEDFPALPSESPKKKAETGSSAVGPPKLTMAEAAAAAGVAMAPALPPPLPAIPGGGKWDDEMEALDELKNKE